MSRLSVVMSGALWQVDRGLVMGDGGALWQVDRGLVMGDGGALWQVDRELVMGDRRGAMAQID